METKGVTGAVARAEICLAILGIGETAGWRIECFGIWTPKESWHADGESHRTVDMEHYPGTVVSVTTARRPE